MCVCVCVHTHARVCVYVHSIAVQYVSNLDTKFKVNILHVKVKVMLAPRTGHESPETLDGGGWVTPSLPPPF
jgi:hypothetical protein